MGSALRPKVSFTPFQKMTFSWTLNKNMYQPAKEQPHQLDKGGHPLFFPQSASTGLLFRNSASAWRWSAIFKNLLVCQRWSTIPTTRNSGPAIFFVVRWQRCHQSAILLPLFFPQCTPLMSSFLSQINCPLPKQISLESPFKYSICCSYSSWNKGNQLNDFS